MQFLMPSKNKDQNRLHSLFRGLVYCHSSEAFKKLIVLTNIGILAALVTAVGVHNAMGINSPSQS